MIVEIRRGHNVKRFHTTERIREESVGHHSAGVCAILLRLDSNVRREVLVYALMHDVPEYYTGDVPYTAKRDSPELKEELEDMETAYVNNYDIPDPEITVEEYQLFKLADMLDLVLSSIEDSIRGNKFSGQLVTNGLEFIGDMNLNGELGAKVQHMVTEVDRSWQQTKNK